MNTKMKRRMIAATGVIVIVLVVVLAVVGSNAAAKTMKVAEALALSDTNKKIQVEGTVVDNSFSIQGDVLTFSVFDATADPAAEKQLQVRFDGGVAATFGNGVSAQWTGKKTADGVLNCTELVTKCPSKYESASGSLSISDLLGYGDSVIDKPVKVSGIIALGTLGGVDKAQRFVLKEVVPVDSNDETALRIKYDGALSDDVVEGATVVLTGSLAADGLFTATNVALEA